VVYAELGKAINLFVIKSKRSEERGCTNIGQMSVSPISRGYVNKEKKTFPYERGQEGPRSRVKGTTKAMGRKKSWPQVENDGRGGNEFWWSRARWVCKLRETAQDALATIYQGNEI